VRLARGADVSAWFWPLAVPVWRRTQPREEALRRLLYAATRARSGVVGAASLLGELRARGGVESLLSALRWTDGPQLLRACDWRIPSQMLPDAFETDARDEEESSPSFAGASLLLARWAGAWGTEDARTLWLSALLMVEAKPARLLDARLTARAWHAITRATKPAAHVPTKHAPHVAQPHRDASRERTQVDSLRAPQARPMPERTAAQIRSRHAPIHEPEGRGVSCAQGDASARAESLAVEDSKSSSTHTGDERAYAGRAEHGSDESLPFGELTQSTRAACDSSVPLDVDGSPDSSMLCETARHEARGVGVPVLSQGAGLFFLLPVMSRLGIVGLLEAQPHLIELNFPHRLLRYVCERVGVPEEDAVWSALDVEEGAPSNVCAGEALPLAAWTRALRRWCRRHARIGLCELVRREGRLLATRTHIDVVFNQRQVDLRIRRSGLDLDPGWLAWLGRVVLFHYREQEDGAW
ncbi:MAG TPA: hypothetical protein VF754_05025, partial [Pyrinomonadaceae bacterium]